MGSAQLVTLILTALPEWVRPLSCYRTTFDGHRRPEEHFLLSFMPNKKIKKQTKISLPQSGDQLTRHYTSSWFLSSKVTKKNQPSQHWVKQLRTRIQTEIFWPEIPSVVARRPHFGTNIETMFEATWLVTQTKQILLVFVGDVPNLGPNNTFFHSEMHPFGLLVALKSLECEVQVPNLFPKSGMWILFDFNVNLVHVMDTSCKSWKVPLALETLSRHVSDQATEQETGNWIWLFSEFDSSNIPHILKYDRKSVC